MTRNKYGNQTVVCDGQSYRSRREMHRHEELLLLQKAGRIAGLTREVVFVLAPKIKITGEERARPEVRYLADFVYSTTDGRIVVEDAKGVSTPVYRLKKHLMATVHGIHVMET